MKIKNIEKLIAIQKIDKDIEDLDMKIKNHIVFKGYTVVMQNLYQCKNINDGLTKILDDSVNNVEILIDKLAQFDKKFNKSIEQANQLINNEESDFEDDTVKYDQLISFLREYESYLKAEGEKFVNARKIITQAEVDKLNNNNSYLKQMEIYKTKELEKRYKELRTYYNTEKGKLSLELEQLKKDADKCDLEFYYKVKEQVKKLPVLVKKYKDKDLCSGCNMQISPRVQTQLQNEGDCAICEECHRIIYKGD